MLENLLLMLLVVLGISLLIFVHEFGHYICARVAGVRVLVFSLGFGKRIWGFKRGGTDYRLSLLPIGGYVQVSGEDPTNRQLLEPDDLHAKGFLARLFFFSGGVIMNLLFALVAFPLVFQSGVTFPAPVLGLVSPGGAAWEAGLMKGDRVLRVNGKEIDSFNSLIVEIALAGRKPITLVVERGDKTITVKVEPRYDQRRGLREMGARPTFDDRYPKLTALQTDSAAYRAGLRNGDELLAINGKDMRGDAFLDLSPELDKDPDQRLEVRVRRDGIEQVIPYTPGIKPETRKRIGVTAARRRVLALRKHPVLARLDLRPGDHIVHVNDDVFDGDKLDFQKLSGPLSMAVFREGQTQLVTLGPVPVTPQQRATLASNIALAQDEVPPGQDVLLLMVLPQPGGAAAAAGMRPGDRITAVSGQVQPTWEDLVQAVKAAEDKPVVFSVLRSDGLASIEVTPAAFPHMDLGFRPQLTELKQTLRVAGFVPALTKGMVQSVDLIKQLYVTLKRMVTGDVSAKNLGGIVTISRVSYAVAKEGWAKLFWFLAVLSINLAFINVLPIPVLDGGHLLFLLIERIKGSPVSVKVHTYSQILGLVFVVALLVFVTYNDILRLL
ncbi:MAG: RIP metalloprotease RseP [Planctomycetota bacterium]|jgi:regulator of sigma E protease